MKETLTTTRAREWAYKNSPFTSNSIRIGMSIDRKQALFLCRKFATEGAAMVIGFAEKDSSTPRASPLLYEYIKEPPTMPVSHLDYVHFKDISKKVTKEVAVIQNGKPLMVLMPVD